MVQMSDRNFVKLYKEAVRVAGVCLLASSRADLPDDRVVHNLAAALISGGLVRAGGRPKVPARGEDHNEKLERMYGN